MRVRIKNPIFLVLLILAFAACQAPEVPAVITALPAINPSPSAALTSATPTEMESASESLTLNPTQAAEILPGINPLTGMPPSDLALLERRPILVKVENLPRTSRPQWGLSLADIVYEYHTEEGTTRFAALYYGNDAQSVGPIRSARLFDIRLVKMYKSILVFGSAYQLVMEELGKTDFADRLVVEGPYTASALTRYEPEGQNSLILDTSRMVDVIDFYGMDNQKQNLQGMAFSSEVPEGGQSASQVFVRFSGAIYNRWDYDPASGTYLRYVDAEDDLTRTKEVYEQLQDRLTNRPVAARNLVMILAPNIIVQENIYDIVLEGEGQAYLARDGQMYAVKWVHKNPEDVLTLVDEQGNPFPFKPGQTWFEVLSDPAPLRHEGDTWHFTFIMP